MILAAALGAAFLIIRQAILDRGKKKKRRRGFDGEDLEEEEEDVFGFLHQVSGIMHKGRE